MTRPDEAALMLASLTHLAEPLRKNPDAFSEYLMSLHQSGHRTALMDMIYWCLIFGWTIPQWAANAFISASHKVRNAEVRSWDAALGSPYKKGREIDSVRRNAQSFAIYVRVTSVRQGGMSSGAELFALVGAEFKLSKTQCDKLYHEFNKRENTLKALGYSHFPAKL